MALCVVVNYRGLTWPVLCARLEVYELNVNYQLVMERTLREIGERVPRLMLHSCCAPCSTHCLEVLSQRFATTVFYFNPNIAPEEEYAHRVAEQKRLIAQQPHQHPVEFLAGPYCPEDFYAAVRGLEGEKEGGARCRVCFEMRLRQTARAARDAGAAFFTTTLTISPLKDAQLLNQLGEQIGREEGVPFLHADFKKRGGYNRSIELSAQYGLYRQNYCGCVFSRRERGLQ